MELDITLEELETLFNIKGWTYFDGAPDQNRILHTLITLRKDVEGRLPGTTSRTGRFAVVNNGDGEYMYYLVIGSEFDDC